MLHACPRCGSEFERSGHRATTVCQGCRSKDHRKRLSDDIEYRARYIWGHAKRRARKSGLHFSLTTDWVLERLERGICQETGLTFDLKVLPQGGPSNPFCPSLDRIIPKFGYTKNNCRLILLCLNSALGAWGDGVTEYIMRNWMEQLNERRS